jgi:hypothetical protein
MVKMKKAFLLSLLFLLFQISFAQTKINEYGRIATDHESTRIDNFVVALEREPESKGLIIINSGKNSENIGNILRQIDGIKYHLSNEKGINPERILFSVKEGGEQSSKELWIYSKDSPLPQLTLPKLDLSNITTKYLYGSVCVNCEPVVWSLSSDFISLASYANLLKEHPAYTGLIVIHQDSFQGSSKKKTYEYALQFVVDYRNELTKENKVDPKRISIKIAEPIGKDSPMIAKFYIVPGKRRV